MFDSPSPAASGKLGGTKRLALRTNAALPDHRGERSNRRRPTGGCCPRPFVTHVACLRAARLATNTAKRIDRHRLHAGERRSRSRVELASPKRRCPTHRHGAHGIARTTR
ncbi:hypothetical protein WS62_23625 [Burkholderia sp. ABCPW 14]|nr:hypothetical protein WS62_23625 [Burkholderia sp. ABCPW 14]